MVVCAFTQERWGDLSRAVTSLHAQTQAPHEVIVVIDHNARLLRRAERELPHITVVPNRFERGLSGGRNTGVALATGDIVAFLDDDAAAEPGWVATIAARYAEAEVVGVGGLVRADWAAGRPAWFPPELDWVVGCSYRGMPDCGPVRNFIGANMSFRREVLNEVGGFAAALGRIGSVPFGCEETELCLRVSRRYPDGVLYYEPEAAVRHKVYERRAAWGYLRARCYAEGLSKAMVSRRAGSGRALSSERAYVLSTVPGAVGRSLAGTLRGRLSGLMVVLALLTALVMTATGYLVGTATGPWLWRPAETGARPGVWRTVRSLCASRLVPWAGLVSATALWAACLGRIDIAPVATADLGLVAVLPVTFWVALAVLIVSFGLAVARRRAKPLVLAAHVVVLVAILHATPAILYGTLRYSWAWKHVGVTDYIFHHGIDFSLGGILGPYQGWPGFFALNSFLLSASGAHSALPYANWALPVNDLLWLGPVVIIARALTRDTRLVWAAAWLFELGNWVGQDYFSPQAFAFFLYLTVLAVSLRWLWDPGLTRPPATFGAGSHEQPHRAPAGERPRRLLPGWARRPGRPRRVDWRALTRWMRCPAWVRGLVRVPGTAQVPVWLRMPPWLSWPRRKLRQRRAARAERLGPLPPEPEQPPPALVRWALVACLLPLMAAIASSHQLTPFMLTAALTLLAMFRRARPAALPVVMSVITAAWLFYGAWPWLVENQGQIEQGVGAFWGNTSSHLIGSEPVPFDQEVVAWGARGLSAAIVVLAILGYFRYRRHHHAPARRKWTCGALLAVAPMPSVAANSYGGEIIFRAFLFALPFMAIAAAAAFFARPKAPSLVWPRVAFIVITMLLAAGFCLGNYGQEAIDYFPPAEVTASGWLYRNAPIGAQIVAADSNFPWAYTHYNDYTYAFLDSTQPMSTQLRTDPVGTVTAIMKPGHQPASYLVLTRSQEEEINLTGVWPATEYASLSRSLLGSRDFTVVYRGPDATILQLSPAAEHVGPPGRVP